MSEEVVASAEEIKEIAEPWIEWPKFWDGEVTFEGMRFECTEEFFV